MDKTTAMILVESFLVRAERYADTKEAVDNKQDYFVGYIDATVDCIKNMMFYLDLNDKKRHEFLLRIKKLER